MIFLNGYNIVPTIFPDKTSQVWHVQGISSLGNLIHWKFENEAELFHVIPLVELVKAQYPGSVTLEMPYMPYARQDRNIRNDGCFAGTVFVKLIDSLEIRVVVTDVHNKNMIPKNWINLPVDEGINQVIEFTESSVVAFPDEGASKRGYKIPEPVGIVLAYKTRDEATGNITGVFVSRSVDITGKNVLIVDDLCDAGGTFILVAKELYKMGASEVHLYTSHGLYTKGIGVLKEAGIKRIFNHKGEVL